MSDSTIVRVPFHGSEILTIAVDGKPHIILKPAYEAIGVDADKQIKKVQEQVWACTARTAVQVPGGQTRHMVTADMRTFLMSLVTIPVSRVSPEVRETLSAYQCEAADVIEAHWTKGVVSGQDSTKPYLTIMERVNLLQKVDSIRNPESQTLALAQLREAFRAPQSREEPSPSNPVPERRGRMKGITW